MSRLVIATEVFPPSIGGPATFADLLARELSAGGTAVTVVCSSDVSSDPSDSARPYTVRRVDIRTRYRYELEMRAALSVSLARARRGLVMNLERYAVPVAKATRASIAIKVVGDTAWEVGRNNGWVTDGFDEFQARGRPSNERLAAIYDTRRGWLDAASIVITPSEYLRGVVHGWGVPLDHIVAIPNGAQVDEVPDAPGDGRDGEGDGGPLRILFAGRLTNWKGVDTAMLAVHRLDGVTLTVVGDGPELPLLQQFAHALGLDGKVTFLGRRSHGDVLRLATEHDVGVLMSGYEGMSHTLLELSAASLPVVCSDIGGNREVVTHDEDGWLVPYGDVPALAALLDELSHDRGRVARARDAARTMSGRYTFQATATRTAEVLAAL